MLQPAPKGAPPLRLNHRQGRVSPAPRLVGGVGKAMLSRPPGIR
jgi:hypothetical protein